jgi:hypothetical protein
MVTLKGKASIIKQINKVGIKDIKCESVADGSEDIVFALVITTKDDNTYHFTQSVALRPIFSTTEVVYFDETGDGDYVADLGTGFKPKNNT